MLLKTKINSIKYEYFKYLESFSQGEILISHMYLSIRTYNVITNKKTK